MPRTITTPLSRIAVPDAKQCDRYGSPTPRRSTALALDPSGTSVALETARARENEMLEAEMMSTSSHAEAKDTCLVGTLESWPLSEICTWLHLTQRSAMLRVGVGLEAGIV